jgi:rhamnosyl/mannosyltransferase
MTKKKKIGIINKAFHPEIGGIETVVKQHAIALAKQHDVDVIVAGNYSENNPNYLGEGYTLRRFKSDIKIAKTPFSLSLLYWLMRKKYDLIYIHHPYPYASLISLLMRTEIIYYYHSDIIKQKFLKKIFQPFLSLSLSKAKAIISSNPRMVEHSKLLIRYKHKNKIIPFWLDENPRLANKQSHGGAIKKPYFLYFGRLAEYKGLNHLVEAIKELNDEFNFVIAGNGSHDCLLDDISHLPNVTIINGNISESQKYNLIEHAYFLLFPSTSENEAFGIVQLEALSQALPIINTKLMSGVPWVARDGIEAITIAPGNTKALVQALRKAKRSPKNRERLADGARKRFSDFDKAKLEADLLKVFDH